MKPFRRARRDSDATPRRALRSAKVRALPVLLGLSLALGVPASVSAAPGWQISRTPSAIEQGVTTDVHMRIKNTGGQDPSDPIGCVQVRIQSDFTLGSPTITQVSNGRSWTASVTTGAPFHTLTLQGVSGSDRLRGGADREEVHVRVPVTGTVLGDYDWTAIAYSNQNCGGSLNLDKTLGMTVTTAGGAPVNSAPVAADDAYSTSEDVAVSDAAPGVLVNDADPDGDPMTAQLVAGPSNAAAFTLDPDGSFSYAPAPDWWGTDTFTYVVSDGIATSSIATVSLTVAAVDDPPVAVDDAYATDEDVVLSVTAASGVLVNDVDVEGGPLTAQLATGASKGLVLLAADGSFTYTPLLHVNGVDAFTYTVSDGTTTSAPATVTITIGAVDDPPIAVDDAYAGDEDVLLVIDAAAGVLANDDDADGDSLSAVLVSGPANAATFSLAADGSFTYFPSPNWNGVDAFTYRASDGTLTSAPATVTLSVAPVNDAPSAQADVYASSEDAGLSVPAGQGVLVNDDDPDGDSLSAVLVSGPANAASFSLAGDGSFTYEPRADWWGTDTFTYRVSDGAATSPSTTVEIVVAPMNDLPVAAPDAYAVDEDTPLVVSASSGVLANDSDVDGDDLSAVLVDGPSSGTVTLAPDGSFTYVPPANTYGSATFTYRAFDGTASSSVATVTITIAPVNDRPTAVDDSASTIRDVAILVEVLANDSDPDGDELSILSVGTPSKGTASVVGARVRYQPPAGFVGTASFSYRITDGTEVADAVVEVVVLAPAPTPTAAPEPEPSAEPEPKPEPGAEPGPSAVPEPDAEPGPSAEPSAEPESSTEPSAEPESSTEPAAFAPPRRNGDGGNVSGVMPLDRPQVTTAAPTSSGSFGWDGFAGGLGSSFDWAVPAYLLGVPGLLFMLVALVQVVGAAAWVPAIRRTLGGLGWRRRRRGADSPASPAGVTLTGRATIGLR